MNTHSYNPPKKKAEKLAELEKVLRHDPNTEVFIWGSDRNGQLGLGDGSERDRNLAKGMERFVNASPRMSMFGMPIKLVACGDDHSAFVTAHNYLYVMGSNRSG
jgi:alpha-tubulin suppressor-like RCC1 family protein